MQISISFYNFFVFRLGVMTSSNPLPVIIISVVFTLLGSIGLTYIKMENNAIKLWIPQKSDFTKFLGIFDNFPKYNLFVPKQISTVFFSISK